MSNVAGNPAAVPIRESPGWDRQSGPFLQKVWRGTKTAIYGTAAELVGADNYIIEPEGNGVFTLTARWSNNTSEGGSETPVREERLRFNEVQMPIERSPEFSALTSYQIDVVRKRFEEQPEETNSSLLPLQQVLLDLKRNGINSYNVYQPTVIVTDTASASYPWNIGFTNYGYTFDTPNMILDAALTSGWKNNLPNDTYSGSGFLYGWLKKPPEIVTVAGNKTQLVQEYVYGLWATAVLPRA